MAINAKPVSCEGCGQSWPRHPALEVACPKCFEPIGSPCKRPSGHGAQEIHVEREQLAVDQGILPLCPEGPTMKRRLHSVQRELAV